MHVLTAESVGYLISAALMCLDYVHLGISHALREPMIFTSFVIKLSFIIVELSLVIVFRVTEAIHYKQNNMAATLEWGMSSLLFMMVLFSFTNLHPSHRLRVHWLHSLLHRRSTSIDSKTAPCRKRL
jgi:hypothetical protein